METTVFSLKQYSSVWNDSLQSEKLHMLGWGTEHNQTLPKAINYTGLGYTTKRPDLSKRMGRRLSCRGRGEECSCPWSPALTHQPPFHCHRCRCQRRSGKAGVQRTPGCLASHRWLLQQRPDAAGLRRKRRGEFQSWPSPDSSV